MHSPTPSMSRSSESVLEMSTDPSRTIPSDLQKTFLVEICSLTAYSVYSKVARYVEMRSFSTPLKRKESEIISSVLLLIIRAHPLT